MKISHSASPRNRSMRNSRSPAATAGVGTAVGAGCAIAAATSARAGAATRSVIDTIQPRLENTGSGSRPDEGSYRPAARAQVLGGILAPLFLPELVLVGARQARMSRQVGAGGSSGQRLL